MEAAWVLHAKVVTATWFEAFVMINILAVGVATGISLEQPPDEEGSDPTVARAVEVVTQVTTAVFIAEVTHDAGASTQQRDDAAHARKAPREKGRRGGCRGARGV